MKVNEMVWEILGGFVQNQAHDEIRDVLDSAAIQGAELDAFINARCDDWECLTCGQMLCPYGEPLHQHHDGCPACDSWPRAALI